jgi:hypothetical protein
MFPKERENCSQFKASKDWHTLWLVAGAAGDHKQLLLYQNIRRKSMVFWDVMQHRLVKHRCFGTIYRSQVSKNTWPLKMRPISSPETSVLNQPTLHNITEDHRIQVNLSKSLCSRKMEHSSLVSIWKMGCFLIVAYRLKTHFVAIFPWKLKIMNRCHLIFRQIQY